MPAYAKALMEPYEKEMEELRAVQRRKGVIEGRIAASAGGGVARVCA